MKQKAKLLLITFLFLPLCVLAQRQVTVKGKVMDAIDVEKEGRKFTDVIMYQKGQRELIRCRVPRQKVTEGAEMTFSGKLMVWRADSGIGMMVYCVTSGDY